jgi:hypothetical protein
VLIGAVYVARDEIADQVQLAVEEMVGAWHHNHR